MTKIEIILCAHCDRAADGETIFCDEVICDECALELLYDRHEDDPTWWTRYNDRGV